jgi:hypothetical protein
LAVCRNFNRSFRRVHVVNAAKFQNNLKIKNMLDQTDQVQVTGEADGEELKAILNEITPGFITPEHIDVIVRKMAQAKALLLHRSNPLEDGSLRCELWGGEIIHVKRKDASVGTGVADGVEIPEHFQVHTKLHSHTLDALGAALGLPCKNG